MLNRRNFFKKSMVGVGALSLAPMVGLSAADLAAGKGQGQFPKRFIFIRKSNGQRPHEMTPLSFSDALKEKDTKKEAFEEPIAKHEMQDWLQVLDDYKDRMTILQGLSSKMSENSHYSHQSVMGCFKSNGGNINALKRATIDYELAKLFPSPFGHIEFSFSENREGIVSGLSVPAPYQKNSCYGDSISAYRDLFKCVTNPELINSDNEMLQYLEGAELNSGMRLNELDANSIKNHVSTIELMYARNQQLAKMVSKIEKHMPDWEKIQDYGKTSSGMPLRQEAMTDVLVAALVSGLTNVVTYTIDTLGTSITGLPGYEKETINIHGVGHGGGEEKRDIRRQMDMQHLRQVKTIVEALKAQPEGNGTMFDNTMIMYFPENGETHHGSGVEEPFVIISGKNSNLNMAGKYIRLPFHATEGHQTLGNWYTTLLNAHGNPIKHYGDPDAEMARLKFPQEGAIKQFIKA